MTDKAPVSLYLFICSRDTKVHVKIGLARDPKHRAQEIQTGCPFPLTELRYVPIGDRRQAYKCEQMVHRNLASFQTWGEWFEFELGNAQHADTFRELVRYCIRQCKKDPGRWVRLVPERKGEVMYLEEVPLKAAA